MKIYFDQTGEGEMREQLIHAIHQLEGKNYIPILLGELAGKSNAEIGREIGESGKYVRKRKPWAHKALKEYVEEFGF